MMVNGQEVYGKAKPDPSVKAQHGVPGSVSQKKNMSVRTLANIYLKVLAPLKRTASWRRSYDVHEQRQKVRVDTPSGMGSKGQHKEKRTQYWHQFFHKPRLEKPHVGVSKPWNSAIHINNNPSSLYVASRRSDILDTEENEPEDVYLDPISTDTTSGDHGFIEDYLNQSLTTLARLTPSSSASNVLYKALKEGSYDDILSLRDSDAQEALDVMQEILSESQIRNHPYFMINRSRHTLHRVMRRLSYSTEKLPTSFKLDDVECPDLYTYGVGGYADVFCGVYQSKKVALKRLRIFQIIDESKKRALRQSFYREALVWQGLNHAHILPFLGISEQVFGSSLCMVSPWLANGNALQHRTYLIDHQKLCGKAYLDTIHRWCLETALGLQYLHGIDIIHGDVRGPNLLVDDDESIRLGDFGLSAVAEVESSYASSSGGAWGWMAPELIDPEEFGLSSSTPTRASDIYSFASVCIELYTGAAPFSGSSGQVVAKILKGLRPLRPQHEGIDMDECLWNLLNEC